MGCDMSQRGNTVRYNYFHDVGGTGDVQAVYLDDCFCGTTVFGNVIVNCGRGVLIGGGRDNLVANNIFINSHPAAVHVDARGKTWASYWFDGRDNTLMSRLAAVRHNEPPYSTRYPGLATLLSDDPAMPKGNRIANNICVGGNLLELYDNLTDEVVSVVDNLANRDPLFVNAQACDYRLRPESPALGLGFQPIPLGEIGLYADAYRPHPIRSFRGGSIQFSLYAVHGSPGETVALRTLVYSAGAPVSGLTVQFAVDGSLVGAGVSDAAGAACTYGIPVSMAHGEHTVTASFAGDGTYGAASRTAPALTVNGAQVSLSLYAVRGCPGETVTLKTLVYSAGAPVSGLTVQFAVDGSVVGTGVSDAAGAACGYMIPASLGYGEHTVTASFAGDGTFHATSRSAPALAVNRTIVPAPGPRF